MDTLYKARGTQARAHHKDQGHPLPALLLRVLGGVRRAAVMTSEDLGFIPTDRAEWVAMAAQELMDGLLSGMAGGPDVMRDGWSDLEIVGCTDEILAGRAAECMVSMDPTEELINIPKHVSLFLGEGQLVEMTARFTLALFLEERWLPGFHEIYPEVQSLLGVPGVPGTSDKWAERFAFRLQEILGSEFVVGGGADWRGAFAGAWEKVGQGVLPFEEGKHLSAIARIIA